MELTWFLFILCVAISTASHIDTGRIRHLMRSQDDSEIPLNRLQRRGKKGRKRFKERSPSSGNISQPELRHQRSGSSYHLPNSVSTNSLGVEDKGVAKPIPKRYSEKQLGRERSTEYQRSLGAKSVNDLRTLDASKGSRDSLFGWANQHATDGRFGSAYSSSTHQTMAGGYSPPPPQGYRMIGGFSPPPPQAHQMIGTGLGAAHAPHNYQPPSIGFGFAPGLHNLPGPGGFPGSVQPPVPTNSRASSKSGSGMSIDGGEEVQGRRRMQRLNAVEDLTMIDAMPYARERMRIGDRSPTSSDWGTSSSGGSSGQLSP
ncbi:MAG: hypothetical protein GOMPHAMPRED_003905 [Gomphillus americanus]|uniref:Uncharacterized protein n=1 Tax=Gomphillus americanus TaxID=1940652 RepID=A0A8H3FLD4_9LECA|nr:MAG: hypothetical protein GOMPHAMPRED_003905 [Gomphillus americanus]